MWKQGAKPGPDVADVLSPSSGARGTGHSCSCPLISLPCTVAFILCLRPLGLLLNCEEEGRELCLSASGRSRQGQGVPMFIVKVIIPVGTISCSLQAHILLGLAQGIHR